jgi:uncharacterized protein (DUF305 family)
VRGGEVEKMRGWYVDWYGMDVPNNANGKVGGMMGSGMGTVMNSGMMGTGTRRNASGPASAEDFDKAFIVEMMPHHQMALMMSTMVLVHGEQSELRDLARSIVNQSAEIEKLRGWYIEWYGTGKAQP